MNISNPQEAGPEHQAEGNMIENEDAQGDNPQSPDQGAVERPDSLNLTVVLPENEGHISFCSGIIRGLKMVQDAHAKAKGRGTQIGYEHEPPQSLPIIQMLQAKGLPIKELTGEDDPDEYVMVISPYGMPRREYQGEHFDTTCIQVKRTRELAEKLDGEGYTVIFCGEQDHSERFGLEKKIGKAVVALSCKDDVVANLDKLKEQKKIALISQSSSDPELTDDIAQAINQANPACELVVEKTVCQEIQGRVKSAADLGEKCDIVLVLAPDQTSGHAQRMMAAAKDKGSKAIFVSNPKDLKDIPFVDSQKVGLISSISTPPELAKAIIKYLKAL